MISKTRAPLHHRTYWNDISKIYNHKHCSSYSIIRGSLVEMFHLRTRLYGMNSIQVRSRTFNINDQTMLGTSFNSTKTYLQYFEVLKKLNLSSDNK